MERTAGWCSQEPNKEELLWNELPDGAVRNPIRRNYYWTSCRMVQSRTKEEELLRLWIEDDWLIDWSVDSLIDWLTTIDERWMRRQIGTQLDGLRRWIGTQVRYPTAWIEKTDWGPSKGPIMWTITLLLNSAVMNPIGKVIMDLRAMRWRLWMH